MKKWISVDSIGDISIEKELLYMDYPVLFVARSGEDIFLVENIDNEEGIFLASKTTYRKILDLLTGKNDIRSSMLDSDRIRYILYDSQKDEYCQREVSAESIPDEDLPDRGTFYTCIIKHGVL